MTTTNHTEQDLAASSRNYFQDMYGEADLPAGPVDISTIASSNALARHYYARLQQTLEQYHLQDARALEVGAGGGVLQTFVHDYVGVDIAASAGKYIWKPFVAGSATELPFATSSFDIVWSVWVLEHVPDPEAMLREVRRVLKPGGLFFLCAAWDVPPWVAQGYDVRPFADLDWRGKLVKLSLLFRNTMPYRLGVTLLGRVMRQGRVWATGDQTLAFGRLEPNFETYWSSDADACIAIDSHAVWQWMTAQGDECIGVPNAARALLLRHTEPLLFRVKPHEQATHAR